MEPAFNIQAALGTCMTDLFFRCVCLKKSEHFRVIQSIIT